MKRIINKTTMAIILALSMVLALFSGLLFVRHNEVANAASTPMNITYTTDKDELFPGDSFKLTLKIEVTGTTDYYHSISIFISPLVDAATADTANLSLFTFSNYSTNVVTNKNWSALGLTAKDYYFNDTSGVQNTGAQAGMFKFSLSKRSATKDNDYNTYVTTAIEMSVDVTVAESTPKNTTYTFGAQTMAANLVYINSTSNAYRFNDSAKTTVNNVNVLVREASDNNNLGSLKVGQGDDKDALTPIDPITETGMTVTITDPSMPLSVLPTTEHNGAKVTLKPDGIAVEKGEIGKINVPANGKVIIEVEAENGSKKTFELNVTVKGAALTALTVTPDSTTAGVTKKGLDLTATDNAFDPAVEAYTVYVPNDSENISVMATVNTTYSGSPTMGLAKTGSWNTDATATSGTAFTLTGVSAMADNDTLTIECKDTDGKITKTYVLTFDVVDVDTSLSADPTVVGTTTSKTFANSTLRAEENSKDYYYMLVGDTSANVTIVSASSTAKLNLNGAAYTSNTAKTLSAGEHTLTVEAEAGNTKEYKIVLKNQEVLKLASDATADFVYNKVVEDLSFTYQYVASYKKNSMVHGIDDINFERLVIGKVLEQTSVMDFLANFDSSQLSKIRLYDLDDELLFDCGNPGAGYDEEELTDTDYYVVCTGWRVELIVGGQVEDTIYVSILGDVNGDGYVDGTDMAVLVNFVSGVNTTTLDDLEYLLAAMVTNSGYVASPDITDISEHANSNINIPETYYDKF